MRGLAKTQLSRVIGRPRASEAQFHLLKNGKGFFAQNHRAAAATFTNGDKKLAFLQINTGPFGQAQLAFSSPSEQEQFDEGMQEGMCTALAGAQQTFDLRMS